MKKKIVLFFSAIIFTASLQLMAQQNDSVLATVTYHFTHVTDLNDPTNPVVRDMVLNIAQANSLYQSAAIWNQQLANEKAYAEMMKKMSSGGGGGTPTRVMAGSLAANVSGQGVNARLYQIPSENKIVQTEQIGSTSYAVTTARPSIEWKIQDDSRMIGSFHCQQAIGSFGGRTYIAWFTAELPFSYGPWKLGGLPGLILEAKDTKGEVQFVFRDITRDSASHHIALSARKRVETTEQALNQLYRTYLEDPAATAQSQFPGYDKPIPVFYTDESGKTLSGDEAREAIKKELKKKTSNPLELK